MIVKDKGFVLKKVNFRETSIIVSFFTEKYGKMTGILKGFYSPKKEFTTSMERFTLNEIVFYPKKTQVWLVSFADLLREYSLVRRDYEKYIVTGQIFNLVEQVMPLWDRNEKVFRLLEMTLDNLADLPPKKLMYVFLIKFLHYCGVKPEFHLCIQCHRELKGAISFSTTKGGLVCWRCRRNNTDLSSLAPEVIASLRYLQRYDFPHILRIKPSSACEDRILNVLDTFLAYHLEFKMMDQVYS